jgi:histidinol-phosphatase (PHP family)
MKFNLHTHTDYCDGTKKVKEMIEGALKYNYDIIGISSHGPLPFESDWTMPKDRLKDYIKEVNKLKKVYENRIKVLVGLELDYIPDFKMEYIDKEIFNELDYWIGSVHFLGKNKNGDYWTVDYNEKELRKGVEDSFEGDIKKAVETYYKYLEEMVEIYQPTILGHLDLIKKNNGNSNFFNENEKWYRDAVFSLLEKIKKGNTVIELNTGGKYRGYTLDYYPSNWILKEIKDRNIPITVSRDAHDVKSLNYDYEESIRLLTMMGFKNISCFDGEKWKELKI